MDRISLVSKVEKKLIYFLQKMIKSKRLTAGLLKKKPTWSFIQTIFITTFAALERNGGAGEGGSRRKIKEFVMSSFA